jgi:bifunctional non-homologous end joining protein LigD
VWLKPVLVAQIAFLEWTGENHLRHTKFVGLREDKAAREVRRE